MKPLLLILLLLSLSSSHSQDFFNADVIAITSAMLPLKGTWSVMFYAPWCGHCKSFKPDYAKTAVALKGIVNVGAVNCDEESNKPLCGKFEIKGFPTVKVFNDGVPTDYQGQRNAKELHDYLINVIPNYVKTITLKSEEGFLANKLPKVILFTDKKSTSPLFKSLSNDYNKKVVLGEIRDKDLFTKYEITKSPTLLMIVGEEKTVYDGKFDGGSLRKFINKLAGIKEEEKKEKPKAKKQEGPSQLITLTTKNFESLVLNSTLPWMVEFMAPWCGHCKNLAPEWEKAANGIDMVNFGVVDSTVETELAAKFRVSGYPTIKYFEPSQPGKLKKVESAKDYKQGRTAADLIRFANSLVPSGKVAVLNSEGEWQAWSNEIKVATESKKFLPHLFLFSEKPVPGQMIKALAHFYQGRVNCVMVGKGLEAQIWKTFQVTSAPSFALMLDPMSDQGVIKYSGPANFRLITSWTDQITGLGKAPGKSEPTDVTPSAPKVLNSLAHQGDFTKECLDKLGLCVVGLLPPDSHPTNGVKKYTDILSEVLKHYSSKPLNFMYLDTIEQIDFVQKLGRYEGDLSVVAMNPRKNKVANFMGSFTAENIIKFLDALLSGDIKSRDLKVIPTLIAAPEIKEEKKSCDEDKCTAPSSFESKLPPKEEL